MTSLLVYSDDAALARTISESVPAATVLPFGHRSQHAANGRLGVAVRRGDATAATDDLIVAALRADGVPAGRDRSPALLPTVTFSGHDGDEALAAALKRWSAARSDRAVVLAAPRAACAGVDRAVEIVELALRRFGRPVYVRKQIVHNEHVVADLAGRGAVFVESVEEVPHGATVVFSAHGVSPAVRAAASDRNLVTIDATCPLVAKVHSEARKHAEHGRTIAFIGHAGHEETEGTLGEAPGVTHLVETVEDAETFDPGDPERVAFLTQTTLATAEAERIASVIRRRFPTAHGPRGADICYATTNRQQAVQAVASRAELVLVVGSATSSNANRLVEVASRAGSRSVLIEDATELDPALLTGVTTIGLTAAASTPEPLVEQVLDALRGLGEISVDEVRVAREDITFTLPAQLR